MVALFLACLGSGYLYHGFINQKIQDIAILVSMGATKVKLMPIFCPIILAWDFSGDPVSCTMYVCHTCTFWSTRYFRAYWCPSSYNPFQCSLGNHCCDIWWMADRPPKSLENTLLTTCGFISRSSNPGTLHNKFLFLFTLGVLAFWLLCLLQTDSTKLANIFFISLLVSIFLLYLFVRFGLWILNRFCLLLCSHAASGNPVPGAKSNKYIHGLSRTRHWCVTAELDSAVPIYFGNEIGSTNQSANLPKLFLLTSKTNN